MLLDSLIKNVVITSTKENEMFYAVSFSCCCCYFFFFSLTPCKVPPPPPPPYFFFAFIFSSPLKKSLQDLFLLSCDEDMKEVFFTSGFYCIFSFVIWENIFSCLSL